MSNFQVQVRGSICCRTDEPFNWGIDCLGFDASTPSTCSGTEAQHECSEFTARTQRFSEKVNLVAPSDIARLFMLPLLLKAKSRQKPVALIQASNW